MGILAPRLAALLALGCLTAAAPAYGQTPAEEPEGGDENDEKADPDEGGIDIAKRKNRKWPESTFADVRADDWFTLSRPLLEIDGYLRVRSEMFHNFGLGRADNPAYDPLDADGTAPLWPRPPDDSHANTAGRSRTVQLCGAPTQLEPCTSDLQAGANLRLRLEPTLSISDNVKIHTQIDVLDNVVLGSTPAGYANEPRTTGYQVVPRGGYDALGAFSATQWAPQSGVTSTQDTIAVKRAWGDYMSPLGRISFGRMPNHWGVGMLFNAGDGYDSDWQTTVDRIMFTYAFPDWGLYVSGAWDFANEGPTSSALHGETGRLGDDSQLGAGFYEQNGQRYDVMNSDDLDQYVVMIVRRMEEQQARRWLAKGLPVVDAGIYFAYQRQSNSNESTDPDHGASLTQAPSNVAEGLVRRGYEAAIGDLWLDLRFYGFHAAVEAALWYGTVENTLRAETDYENAQAPLDDGWTIRQFGIAAETEYRAIENRLRLGFDFGFASGDSDVASIRPTPSGSSASSMDRQLTLDRTFSTFRFHPDYRVDLILFRNILTRVTGAYYFKPHVGYDFLRDPDGHRLGGGASVIWSRASEPVQAPGHAPDLGVEVDLKLLYQFSPGAVVTDDVMQMGGFYTALEYGVLFPLDGLGYLPGDQSAYQSATGQALEIGPAQMLRWFLGVMF
jgi:uncharacterized protein (TIGR04551 family)